MPRMSPPRVVLAALTSLAVPAIAQDAPAAGADTPPPTPNTQLTANPTQTNPTQAGGWYRWDDGQPRLWNVQAELSYWYVALSGDVTLPGSASDEVSFDDLNLDSAEGALMAELHIRRDRWRFSANAYDVSSSGDATVTDSVLTVGDAIAFGGETVSSSVDLTSFELTASYRFFESARERRFDGRYKSVSSLDAVVGVRFYDLDIEFDVDLSTRTSVFLTPSEAGAEQLFAHPVVGLRWEWEIHEQFDVNVQSTIGGWSLGDNTSYSWDIMVGFAWRPTPNFGAQIGYRNQFFHFEDTQSAGDFEWSGGVAGVYAGAVIRF